MRNVTIGVVVAAVIAWFVGNTTPGHWLLNALGFALPRAMVAVAKAISVGGLYTPAPREIAISQARAVSWLMDW